MENNKSENKKPTKKILIITLCAVLCISAAVFGIGKLISNNSGLSKGVITDSGEDGGITLSTPVGDFVCTSDWSSNIKIKVVSEKEPYAATFYGKLKSAEAPLFTVYIGENGEGYLFGTAPDKSGTVSELKIDIHELPEDGKFSDSDKEMFLSLQERVNDIIDQFNSLDGFSRN